MRNLFHKFLTFLLTVVFFLSSASASTLETQRHDASILFDSVLPSPPAESAPSKADDPKYSTQNYLAEAKEILSSGQWEYSIPQMRQFMFRHAEQGWLYQAQSVGLEGFLWTKKELESKYGADKFIHHLNDYFVYLDALLRPVSWTQELRDYLSKLKNSDISVYEKNAKLNAALEHYVSGLRKNVQTYDMAQWAKKARIYELFPRAYNLNGRRNSGDFKTSDKKPFFRDFQISDFDAIKRMGFDAVWPMGILPIGVRGQTGTGGGSPYSIIDHSTVNPELGAEEDFRNFVKKAHQAGLKVIVDFVVNHTSLDSKLLNEDPNYFINYLPANNYQACSTNGYFEHFSNGRKYCIHHGGFEYGSGISTWIDTAQIDYSNPALRKRMGEIVKGWVAKFDVDGFRVDMAYLALNNAFARTWKKTMPPEEFYARLISQVKAVKPSAAFIAEAYAFQEDLSAYGFDAIYSKYEHARPEGQTGWYEAAAGANGFEQASAVNRAAYLAWQRGGAGSVSFIGNHDEPAPEKIYGRRLPAALMLTMLMPGAVMVYSGAEIGYDAAIPTEHKPLPFSVPVQIDWNSGNSWVKQTYQNVFSIANNLRRELVEYDIEPIWPRDGGSWVGYVMKSKTRPGVKKTVIANMTWQATGVHIPEFGISAHLQSGEYLITNLP